MAYGSSSFGSESYGGLSNITPAKQIIFFLTGYLLKSGILKTFSLDAKIVLRNTKTFSLDAKIVLRNTKTFSLDANIQQTKQKTFIIIGTTSKSGILKTFSLDARLIFRKEKTTFLDARIFKNFSKTFTLNTRIYVSLHWLNPWKNRKKKTVASTRTIVLTNFIEQITVHKGAGTDTRTDVFLNNKCRDDFGDIRFTDSDGSRLLNYKIVSFVSGISAVVNINIPYLPAAPDTHDIYIYYNNSAATDAGVLIGNPIVNMTTINLIDTVSVSSSTGGCIVFINQIFSGDIPSGLIEAWVAKKGLTLKSDIIGGGVNGVAADDVWALYINNVLEFSVSLSGDVCLFTGTLPCTGSSPSNSSGQSVNISSTLLSLAGQSVSFNVKVVDALPVQKWATSGAVYLFSSSAINVFGTEESKSKPTIFRTHRVGLRIING